MSNERISISVSDLYSSAITFGHILGCSFILGLFIFAFGCVLGNFGALFLAASERETLSRKFSSFFLDTLLDLSGSYTALHSLRLALSVCMRVVFFLCTYSGALSGSTKSFCLVCKFVWATGLHPSAFLSQHEFGGFP